jgi:hypothetical protein
VPQLEPEHLQQLLLLEGAAVHRCRHRRLPPNVRLRILP